MTKTSKPRPKTSPISTEQPLIDDIRLLGRILGDVIREQEGEDTFALVEQIRQLSVAGLIGESISRISSGQSLSSMFVD